jgi:hypothetical protein
MMPLSNDNDCELRNSWKLHVGKRSCKDDNRTLSNEIKDKRHTFDLRNLVVYDLLELAFGDAIAEEDGALGEGLVAVTAGFELVVDMHANAVLNTRHQRLCEEASCICKKMHPPSPSLPYHRYLLSAFLYL